MKNWIAGLIALIILGGFTMARNDSYDRNENFISDIQTNTAKMIQKKYNIQPCGAGVSMPGGPVKTITLCFDTRRPLSRNHLREVLVASGEMLLSNILINDEIQSFLKDKPFTMKNIGIIIYNNDSNGGDVFCPEISVARLSEGVLVYRTTDVNNPLSYNNNYKETYEEALKLLQQ